MNIANLNQSSTSTTQTPVNYHTNTYIQTLVDCQSPISQQQQQQLYQPQQYQSQHMHHPHHHMFPNNQASFIPPPSPVMVGPGQPPGHIHHASYHQRPTPSSTPLQQSPSSPALSLSPYNSHSHPNHLLHHHSLHYSQNTTQFQYPSNTPNIIYTPQGSQPQAHSYPYMQHHPIQQQQQHQLVQQPLGPPTSLPVQSSAQTQIQNVQTIQQTSFLSQSSPDNYNNRGFVNQPIMNQQIFNTSSANSSSSNQANLGLNVNLSNGNSGLIVNNMINNNRFSANNSNISNNLSQIESRLKINQVSGCINDNVATAQPSTAVIQSKPVLSVTNEKNESSTNTTSPGSNTSASLNLLNQQISYLINLPLTMEEEEILSDYDCRLYGFLKLESNDQMFKKYFLLKAINCYEKRVKICLSENSSLASIKNQLSKSKQNNTKHFLTSNSISNATVKEKSDNELESDRDHPMLNRDELRRKLKSNRIKLAKLYLSLGHFYLLLYDYVKSLNSYQKFLTFNVKKLKDSTFYYGLGIVYFVFGALKFSEKSFLCALYKDSYFQRVNEIHFRLGLIYKELNNFQSSLKHFKLALIDTLSSLSSVSKPEIKFCIAHLYESNVSEINSLKIRLKSPLKHDFVLKHKYAEAVEKYEEIFKQTESTTPTSLGNNQQHSSQSHANTTQSSSDNSAHQASNAPIDASLKSKIYRQLGWLYFYADSLSKPAPQAQTELISPFRTEFKPTPIAKQISLLNLSDTNPPTLNRKSLQLSIEYLVKSARLDSGQNLTWYYLGRAFTCKSSSREAFISLKNSVNNPESSSDTWCSIGVLYYLQKQQMDSLHAFVCALQADPKHYSSWLNLGILYEQNSQLEEALKCYKCAAKLKLVELVKNSKLFSFKIEQENGEIVNLENLDQIMLDIEDIQVDSEHDKLYKEELIQLIRRVKILDQYLEVLGDQKLKEKSAKLSNSVNLPNLQEAFKLEIPADLKQKIQLKNQKNQFLNFTLNSDCINSFPKADPLKPAQNSNPAKRQKMSKKDQIPAQLKPQQVQLMHQLELSLSSLNPDQRQMLNHLKSQSNQAACSSTSTQPDQLPHDLENVQPLTMIQDDITMLQDMNSILNDRDKTCLDQILTKTESSSSSNQISHKISNLTFNNEHVKLDPALTNGSLNSKPSRNVNSTQIELTDDQVLCGKLSIGMSSDQVLDTCKSYGLNGIQNNCLLKPGRLRNRLILGYKTESELIDEEKEEEKEKAYLSDSSEDELEDSIPYGTLEASSPIGKNLCPQTPSVVLENKKEAYSPQLHYFCLSNPISVIRGLGSVLKLDLGLFSTKSLVETDPDHLVEVRNQKQQPSDQNWEPSGKSRVWKCDSFQSYTTLLKYAKYQANTFQEAVREEKLANTAQSSKNKQVLSSSDQNPDVTSKRAFKSIKFGTNVDLSDENKWRLQIQEMAKLPPFMRIVSAGNMITHVGHKIYGVNTMQMYLKVPGCRTPGHQENNNFCSLNMNIGPGDCEWFGVDEKYWKKVEDLCEKNGIDFLNGSWWPNLQDLHEAKIPVFRFLQKPGDLVWVNVGCVHWVQSVGWCNNVSWNVGPLVYLQYKSAIERYEWNRLKFYKSIVPMVHLTWNIARHIKITDRRLFEYIKYVLMHTLKQSQLAINYVENCGCEIKYQARQVDEPAHYCYDCESEVFNVLFVSEQSSEAMGKERDRKAVEGGARQMGQHVVHCQACARKRNHLLDNFVILNQYQIEDLRLVYDQFQMYVPSAQHVLTSLAD